MFKKSNDDNMDGKNGLGAEAGQKRKPLIERLGLVESIEKDPKLPKISPMNMVNEEGVFLDEEADMILDLAGVATIQDETVIEVEQVPVETSTSEPEEIYKEESPAVEEIREVSYDVKRPVREIYGELGIDTGDIGTIYMVENFINALPATLPQDVRRQSLKALIQASHLDMRNLLKDGDERLRALSEYKGAFEATVASSIAENERYIARLNEEIMKHRGIIEGKLALKEAQHFEIEFEVQRLMNIIGFVKNDK